MTTEQAVKILGLNRNRNELLSMMRALELHPYSNTPEEKQRWHAAGQALRHWNSFCAVCAERRNELNKVGK